MIRLLEKIAVCGAGAMGSGIAQVAAQAGASVVVFDTQLSALDDGRIRVAAALAAQVKRGKIDEPAASAVRSRIEWTDRLADLENAELVIEAIIEREDIKVALFMSLEALLPPDTIIATNTSSLSISSLATFLKHPERFLGMHFFNPAPVMRLVEVVAGNMTAPGTVEVILEAAKAWGKSAVRVADVPGFIVNRVARPYYGEAFKALAEGAATPQVIDFLFRESAGFRMGPFELTDLIGQDVNYAVASSIFEAYAGRTRFAPQDWQAALLKAGRLGRKSGSGVFGYGVGGEDGRLLPAADTAGDHPVLTGEDERAFADLLSRRHDGQSPRRAELAGVLVGFSEGRRAATEARETGRKIALFDWVNDIVGAPLAFAASDDAAAATASALASAVSRRAFRIQDRAGLVILRTLSQLVNAACDAARDEVADEIDIDRAMRSGANYPFGLFAWADDFGRERLANVLANIAAETGHPMYVPSKYLRRSQ